MQKRVRDFNKKYALTMPASVRILDFLSESGELSKAWLEATNYQQGENPVELQEIEMELGDVIYALMSFAESLDINAEIALQKTLDKYKQRWFEKGKIGSRD